MSERPADRQVPLDPALEGGVKGHNIKKMPYREATPFRAWSFTPLFLEGQVKTTPSAMNME